MPISRGIQADLLEALPASMSAAVASGYEPKMI